MSTPARIVSLVPSLTELLFALDLGDQVVGRTGFCIHPRPQVRAVPKVGGTKTVNVEAVLALSPTHLLVNIDENEKPTVERLAAHIPQVIVTHPCRVADLPDLFSLLGKTFDRKAQSARLTARLEDAQAAIARRQWRPLRVVYLIWKDPWMTVSADTFIADMLRQVNMEVMVPDDPRRYPEIEWRSLSPSLADRVLFSSEPYRFRERDGLAFASEHGLEPMRCLLIDGEMTSWYGPRAIDGLRYLEQLRAAIEEQGHGMED